MTTYSRRILLLAPAAISSILVFLSCAARAGATNPIILDVDHQHAKHDGADPAPMVRVRPGTDGIASPLLLCLD